VAGESQTVVIKALIANLGIAIAKFVAAGLSGSASMLSEAVHSLADSGNQMFLLIGMSRATRQEDAIHEFGYAAVRYFWGFIVAVSLFTVGATFSTYEGVHRVLHPGGAMGSRTAAYAVLGVSIVLELYSLSAALKEFVHLRTMHLGPEEVLVGMKVVVDDTMPASESTRFIDEIESRLRAELPILKRIYIEIGAPEDPRRAEAAAVAEPASAAAE
jgi:divalent metal cation (Fe/Co/Zn/Cd) transporter